MTETKIYFSSAILLILCASYAIYSILETNILERFYIFDPEQLRVLSQRAIQLHGNDTKALVASIVGGLTADVSVAPYLSIDQECCFNNSVVEMGAM